jgi:poly-gamma-glutamate synthesis protein (capsule biosynthesis protein)
MGVQQLTPGTPRVRLAAVGDLMLGAGVGEKIRKYGPRYPFAAVKALLADADICFANLEWPLTDTSRRHPVIRHRPRYAPPGAVEALEDAGFALLSVANNHIFDCLDDGLADTMCALAERGINWVGAGSSLSAARRPSQQTVNGVRLGFLAYTFPLHQVATEELPGCAPADPKMMLEDVRRLRTRVDHVVVSMHTGPDAGSEFCFYPSVTRQQTCRALLEAGATAVLCHHCHVPQGVEIYRGGLIAHGLGSFITDVHDWFFQSAQPPHTDYVDKGLLLNMSFDVSKLLSFSLRPTRIGPDLAVRPLEGGDKASFLRFLEAVSEPLYDAEILTHLLPSRTLMAKVGRLAAKTRRKGIGAVAAELLRDALAAIDRRLFEPARVRALERELKATRRRIPDDVGVSAAG